MQAVLSLIALVSFIIVTVDVWRSGTTTGAKVGWTVLAFFFSIITLIVWFAWGRKRHYTGARV